MKQRRQAKIIEIVENNDIETQDELLTKLTEAGFNTTQATISRDHKGVSGRRQTEVCPWQKCWQGIHQFL